MCFVWNLNTGFFKKFNMYLILLNAFNKLENETNSRKTKEREEKIESF